MGLLRQTVYGIAPCQLLLAAVLFRLGPKIREQSFLCLNCLHNSVLELTCRSRKRPTQAGQPRAPAANFRNSSGICPLTRCLEPLLSFPELPAALLSRLPKTKPTDRCNPQASSVLPSRLGPAVRRAAQLLQLCRGGPGGRGLHEGRESTGQASDSMSSLETSTWPTSYPVN